MPLFKRGAAISMHSDINATEKNVAAVGTATRRIQDAVSISPGEKPTQNPVTEPRQRTTET